MSNIIELPLNVDNARNVRLANIERSLHSIALGIREVRGGLDRMLELLDIVAEIEANLKNFDAAIARGEIVGLPKVDVAITGGRSIYFLGRELLLIRNMFKRIGISAGGREILAPAVVADGVHGEEK